MSQEGKVWLSSMQKVLRRRILRELKENMPRYLALGAMIILGMYIVISLVAAADAIMQGSAEAAAEQSVEDGQFTLFAPMSGVERQQLESAGITVEEHFYLDYGTADGSTLRVSAVRQAIDRVRADSGRLPAENGEVLLEKRYCEEHDIHVGDEIRIGAFHYYVCGIGSSPDYDAPYRNLSDNVVDSGQFGTAFVTMQDYNLLREEGGSLQAEEYVYAYLLHDKLTDRELKEILRDFRAAVCDNDNAYFQEQPVQILPADDNIRIGGAAGDVVINKLTGLLAGVLLIVLFAYVISVFVVHTIEKESEVIGTLYALGLKRKELLRHYLILPVVLTLIAGIIGTALGYSSFGVRVQMRDTYSYFSIPEFPVVYKPYLLVYGIVMPPVAAALTNLLVIYDKLSRPALALIRREQKAAKAGRLALAGTGFVQAFRIRHFIREKRTAFTVFWGMFLALSVCMIGLNCYVLCEHVRTDSVTDTRYQYLYTLKYPMLPVPAGTEEAYGVILNKETLGYNFDVTLFGIHPDNPYFDAPVTKGQNRAMVSSAMASKYRLRTGDDLVLNDEDNDRSYAFTVDGIVPYSAGMAVFMHIDSMRELMGTKEDHYNMLFADRALEIDPDRLYATSSKMSVEKSAAVFTEKMRPMIRMVTSVSALLFLVVMYLMLKVMIDRCAAPIAMMKIFGYRRREIRKLYLDGNLVIVAVSAAMGIPLAKRLIDAAYPYLVSNVAVDLNLTFGWQLYAGLYAAILGLYLVCTPLLMRRVNRILPAKVLKNRE